MSLASVTSVSATLLMLGVIFLLIINITNLSDYASDQFNVVQVYLDDGLSNEDMRNLGERMKDINGVKSITFETKEQALIKIKEDWKEQASVLDGLEDRNPLPNSYIVEMENLIYSGSVSDEISGYEGVEEVKYYKDVIDKIKSITKLIRDVGLLLIVVLIFVSTFIISNTIKLAVTARKDEIQIMKYVGATHWFVRWPFIVEGMILGLLGAAVSLGIIYFAYKQTHTYMSEDFFEMFASYIVPVNSMMKDLMEVSIPVGTGIGALGSLWGVRKYLNV